MRAPPSPVFKLTFCRSGLLSEKHQWKHDKYVLVEVRGDQLIEVVALEM